MQRRTIDAGRRKVVCVPTVMTNRRVVGGHVRSVGCDGYRLGEVNLLPARSSFRRERSACQQLAAIAPKVGHMSASISGAFVKANAGDVAGSIGIEPYA